MKSSDLVLFRDICDELDDRLYQTLQNPDDEFITEVENGSKFSEYSTNRVEYDFDDMEEKLNVTLRYYQRMALYFTKYYFDKKYLIASNENNKLTYWMATGSGKTVIMKANIIDYFEYLRDKNPDEIEVIITSPLKELIGQLQKEMSEFFTDEFFRDFKFTYKIETTQGLISQDKNESYEIVGENYYRLLLVDEAHIGLGSKEKGSFVNIRNELTKNKTNSFMFEYSATFYDITNKEQIKDYANRIIYEYDYGKFYNDRYGKDFKFHIIKKDDIPEDENKDIKRNLDANLEAFDKKINAFYEFNDQYKSKQFPNRPLLIMAGNTVSASKEKSANNEENSDISKIIAYLANLSDDLVKKYIKIFNDNKGVLHLLQNSSNNGELLMAYGEDAIPFGLITVGDVKKFLDNTNIQKLISNGKIISKDIKFTDENYLFKNIDFESSPINILIGSRKFSAGWNSFRASQICLINFGTGSGSTIIQMFGRGVRLRGLSNDGKRSNQVYVTESDDGKVAFETWDRHKHQTNQEKYEILKYLETLFVYSLRSTYLSKKFIEEDTDIYKKSISITKEVKVSKDHKEKQLPIFYVNKSASEIHGLININELHLDNSILKIQYSIGSKNNEAKLDLPLYLDFTIEEERNVDFKDIKWIDNFIDKSYIQKLILKKLEQSSIVNDSLDYEYFMELLESKKVIIRYDGKISQPRQFQKLIIKVANSLIGKIKNKIVYNETKQSYKLSQSITSDDYIDSYDVKFILDKSADLKTTGDRLRRVDSYSIFIDKIVSHYYQPLALDPHANTKPVFETYRECMNKDLTQNHHNIIDSHQSDGYFKDVEEIKISPDKLDPYELKFICDLQKYINENELNATVLRNKSKGNIGLIADDGIFYPDFIIWYTDKKGKQHIIFCDPKGIRNAETKWKVCEAPYYIKEIEEQWESEIQLHSFIISNTSKKDVRWSPIDHLEDIDQCDLFFNLVFIDNKDYIKRIFEGINQDIKVHQHFMRYLEYYDDTIINEWKNENKRNKHLKNIESIKELKDTELSKKLLVYFLIYKNRDKLKEDIFDDTKEEIKSFVLDEILPETLSAILPGGRILYKTGKWLYSRI